MNFKDILFFYRYGERIQAALPSEDEMRRYVDYLDFLTSNPFAYDLEACKETNS